MLGIDCRRSAFPVTSTIIIMRTNTYINYVAMQTKISMNTPYAYPQAGCVSALIGLLTRRRIQHGMGIMRVKYPTANHSIDTNRSKNAKGDVAVTTSTLIKPYCFSTSSESFASKCYNIVFQEPQIFLLNEFQQAKPSAQSAWKESNANSLGMECRSSSLMDKEK